MSHNIIGLSDNNVNGYDLDRYVSKKEHKNITYNKIKERIDRLFRQYINENYEPIDIRCFSEDEYDEIISGFGEYLQDL